METTAVLLFTATFAILVGYAVRLRWKARRHGLDEPPRRGVETIPVPPRPRAAAKGSLLDNVQMIHVITIILLIASLWIILSNRYEADVQKWAFGTMGSIIGFWLAPRPD
jgi:hypothetical protein